VQKSTFATLATHNQKKPYKSTTYAV